MHFQEGTTCSEASTQLLDTWPESTQLFSESMGSALQMYLCFLVRKQSSKLLCAQVEQWLEFSLVELGKGVAPRRFVASCEMLNRHLTLRTVFSGYTIKLADIAVWAALKVHPLWEHLCEEKNNRNLQRYKYHSHAF
jgi:hypothetical protein